MKRTFKFFAWGIVALVVLFLISVGVVYYVDSRPATHPSLNSKAPDYVLYPTDNPEKSIKLSGLKGKVIVLFWYNRCRGAKLQLPELGKLSEKFKDRIQIFVIDENGDKAPLQKLRHQYKKVFVCNTLGFKEHIFPYSGGYHYVILDQAGLIRAFGSMLDVVGIAEGLAKNEKLSPILQNDILLSLTHYKMGQKDLTNGESLIFHSIHNKSEDGLDLFDDFSIVTVNSPGSVLYLYSSGAKKINFAAKDSLSANKLLKNKYVFAYRIDHKQFGDKINDLSTRKFFKKRIKAKLDSIFKVKSHFVYNMDSTIARLEIEEQEH